MIRAILAALVLTCSAQAAPAEKRDEASLRRADSEQMRIIIEGDAKHQDAFMHPNYLVNAPSNRVLRKAQVVSMLASGKIASETFERTVEAATVTGQVGIVMGRETVKPTADSELGRLFKGTLLQRRFTNVFLWEEGKWRFLARQASVVSGN